MKQIIVFLLSLIFPLMLSAQNYEGQWKNVEYALKASQPRTAQKEAEVLYRMAEQRNNLPQMLRAWLAYMHCRQDVSPDSFRVDMKQLQGWALKCEEPADRALLNLVIALKTEDTEASEPFYHQALFGEDCKSLSGKSLSDYVPLIKLNKGSDVFKHDVLSFIRQTAMESMPYSLRFKWNECIYQRDEDWYWQSGDVRAACQVLIEAMNAGCQVREELAVERYGNLEDYILDKALRENSYQHESACIEHWKTLIGQYPKHDRIKELKQRLEETVRPSLQLHQMNEALYPGQSFTSRLNAYNVQEAEIEWYRLPDTAEPFLTYSGRTEKFLKEKIKGLACAHSEKLPLKEEVFARLDSVVHLTAPTAPGYYVMRVVPGRCAEYPLAKAVADCQLVVVSDLLSLQVPVDDSRDEIWALDRKTGRPVPGVEVSVMTYTHDGKQYAYKKVQQLTTNEKGFAWVKSSDQQLYVVLHKGNDFSSLAHWQSHTVSKPYASRNPQIKLFTDRSLYRPGQEVDFSVLAYSQSGDSVQIVSGESVLVELREVRGAACKDTLRLITDDMGTAHGKFRLAEDEKTGRFQIRVAGKATAEISVEEYRRPTFWVEWKPVEGEYALGDTLVLQGQAMHYSGAPVQDAKVILKANRRKLLWWRTMEELNIHADTLTTDGSGNFTYRLPLTPSDKDYAAGLFYRFDVDAAVTNLAGETHAALRSLSVGAQRFCLSLSYSAMECKENLTAWTVNLYNSAGTELPNPVQMKITPKGKSRAVWSSSVLAGESKVREELKSLPSGHYEVALSYDTVKTNYDLKLFSLHDKQPLDSTQLWVYATGQTMDEEHPVCLQLGTSQKNAFIQVNAYDQNQRLIHREFPMSNSLQLVNIPYQKTWGNALRLAVTMVSEGIVYQELLDFKLKTPDKSLKAEWTSFRDHLQPGQQGTWTLKITRDNVPVSANLMATLYDASLDALHPHHWHLGLNFPRSQVHLAPWHERKWIYSMVDFPSVRSYNYQPTEFDTWEEMVRELLNRYSVFGAQPMLMTRSLESVKAKSMAVNDAVVETAAVNETLAQEEAQPLQSSGQETNTGLRTDLRETAFFFPQLRTDAQGLVHLEFTLPDALTQWHLLGMAHSKDMDYTLLDEKVTASKKLMVQPQLPRFLRVGDVASLATVVQNMTDEELSGTLTLELSDSTLQRVIYKKEMPFRLSGNDSESFRFGYRVPDLGPSIVCRLFAKTDQFADGEQHLLPVLSDKIWITESRAFYLNNAEEQINISDLLHGGDWWNASSTMTVETIHNPLWVVMESLDELKTPPTANAVDLASAYYAASLGKMLADTYPIVAGQKGFSVDSLQGKRWLEQLEKLQGAGGGFRWFPGMYESLYITQMVVEPFLRLQQLNVPLLGMEQYAAMISRSMAYLDSMAINVYEDMLRLEKTQRKKVAPTEFVLHYLYTYSLKPHALSSRGKAALDYFTQRLPLLNKDASLYNKALACIVSSRMGKTSEAQKLMQSLLEYTMYTEELGRYYDSNRSMVSWRNYRIPVQTLLIEALDVLHPKRVKVAPDSPDLETSEVRRQLCQWLLNQRRTQQWKNSSVIMDVLYALLLAPKSDWKATTADEVYEKVSLDATQQPIPPKTWRVNRTNQTADSPMGWTSVFMTTQIPLKEVESDSEHSGFRIQRKYEVEVVKNGKVTYEPLTAQSLHLGQKVRCRIMLRADRDIDFAEIHVARAACVEPVQQLSGFVFQNRIGFFRTVRDTESIYYVDRVAKGEYEFHEEYYVSQEGCYQVGMASVQGTYCPEFADHTESMSLEVPNM